MEKRIYVQLQPDERGIDELTGIQRQLDGGKTGRLLPPEELHVTLIHFGKAADVLEAVRRSVAIEDNRFYDNLDEYVARMRTIVTDETYQLTPRGFGHFGPNGKTLVIEYDAPRTLYAVHDQAYAELARFLRACGIQETEAFIQNDPNFRHAREFKPHVTLYKGYEGRTPDVALKAITVSFMKLVY